PTCSSSSTFSSDGSRITAPAASAVMSLCWPNATPAVAAVRAGASLMPSPRYSVGARAVSRRTIASFCSGVWPACTSVMPTRSASDHPAQPPARRLAHLRGGRDFRAGLARRLQHGAGERVLGVALQARGQCEGLGGIDARGGQHLRQARLAVGERAGLVEDGG